MKVTFTDFYAYDLTYHINPGEEVEVDAGFFGNFTIKNPRGMKVIMSKRELYSLIEGKDLFAMTLIYGS